MVEIDLNFGKKGCQHIVPFSRRQRGFLRKLGWISVRLCGPHPTRWPFSSPLNPLTPNGHFMGLTAQLTSRCWILYIYSTNIRTEYFKYAE